jgi:hypothetical protein
MFFLDLFCGGIVNCFSVEPQWALLLGVSENPDAILEHKVKNMRERSSQDHR